MSRSIDIETLRAIQRLQCGINALIKKPSGGGGGGGDASASNQLVEISNLQSILSVLDDCICQNLTKINDKVSTAENQLIANSTLSSINFALSSLSNLIDNAGIISKIEESNDLLQNVLDSLLTTTYSYRFDQPTYFNPTSYELQFQSESSDGNILFDKVFRINAPYDSFQEWVDYVNTQIPYYLRLNDDGSEFVIDTLDQTFFTFNEFLSGGDNEITPNQETIDSSSESLEEIIKRLDRLDRVSRKSRVSEIKVEESTTNGFTIDGVQSVSITFRGENGTIDGVTAPDNVTFNFSPNKGEDSVGEIQYGVPTTGEQRVIITYVI